MRKHIILMANCILSAATLVTIVSWKNLWPTTKNGFSRIFKEDKVTLLHVIARSPEVVGIANVSGKHLYFKEKTPTKLYRTTLDLQQGTELNLHVQSSLQIISAFNVSVDSPRVYIVANNLPGVIQTDMQTKATSTHLTSSLFTKSITTEPGSFILRQYDTTGKTLQIRYTKMDVNARTEKYSQPEKVDGNAGVDTDGFLSYDPQSKLLMYVSIYSNKVVCLDSMLSVVYQSTTIDTNATGGFQTATLQHDQQAIITNSTPRRKINGKHFAYRNKLFTISKINADNEKSKDFTTNNVLDVYEMKTGKYLRSLYLPFYKGEKISDFKIFQGKMIVLQKGYILSYQLPESLEKL